MEKIKSTTPLLNFEKLLKETTIHGSISRTNVILPKNITEFEIPVIVLQHKGTDILKAISLQVKKSDFRARLHVKFSHTIYLCAFNRATSESSARIKCWFPGNCRFLNRKNLGIPYSWGMPFVRQSSASLGNPSRRKSNTRKLCQSKDQHGFAESSILSDGRAGKNV